MFLLALVHNYLILLDNTSFFRTFYLFGTIYNSSFKKKIKIQKDYLKK